MVSYRICLSVGENAIMLSKTKKKGREHKEATVNAIKEAAEKCSSMYVFSFENMRNKKFKGVQGGTEIYQQLLRGDAGMVFTNFPKEEIERLFNQFEEYDFASTGSTATEKAISLAIGIHFKGVLASVGKWL